MDFFAYQEAGGARALFAEDVPLSEIAAAVGTPVVRTDAAAIWATARSIK